MTSSSTLLDFLLPLLFHLFNLSSIWYSYSPYNIGQSCMGFLRHRCRSHIHSAGVVRKKLNRFLLCWTMFSSRLHSTKYCSESPWNVFNEWKSFICRCIKRSNWQICDASFSVPSSLPPILLSPTTPLFFLLFLFSSLVMFFIFFLCLLFSSILLSLFLHHSTSLPLTPLSLTIPFPCRHNWYVLPPSHTATLLIILNLLTILLTTLILHLSFFGRLLALYKRNLLRVQCLTR